MGNVKKMIEGFEETETGSGKAIEVDISRAFPWAELDHTPAEGKLVAGMANSEVSGSPHVALEDAPDAHASPSHLKLAGVNGRILFLVVRSTHSISLHRAGLRAYVQWRLLRLRDRDIEYMPYPCLPYLPTDMLAELSKNRSMGIQAWFMGRSTLWISPKLPNISNRCGSVTFFVNFSTTICSFVFLASDPIF